jgi:hypothetical protein
MYIKAVLLLICGVMAGLLLMVQSPSILTALLVSVVGWSFARAYYFAFYVIQKYIDPRYRFSGVVSTLRYCVGRDRM